MTRIFFCYAREQSETVEQFRRTLRSRNQACAIEDFVDTDVLSGSDWEEVLGREMRKATDVVLFITPEFIRSNYVVQKELPYFLKRQAIGELTIHPLYVSNRGLDQLEFDAYDGMGQLNGKRISILSLTGLNMPDTPLRSAKENTLPDLIYDAVEAMLVSIGERERARSSGQLAKAPPSGLNLVHVSIGIREDTETLVRRYANGAGEVVGDAYWRGWRQEVESWGTSELSPASLDRLLFEGVTESVLEGLGLNRLRPQDSPTRVLLHLEGSSLPPFQFRCPELEQHGWILERCPSPSSHLQPEVVFRSPAQCMVLVLEHTDLPRLGLQRESLRELFDELWPDFAPRIQVPMSAKEVRDLSDDFSERPERAPSILYVQGLVEHREGRDYLHSQRDGHAPDPVDLTLLCERCPNLRLVQVHAQARLFVRGPWALGSSLAPHTTSLVMHCTATDSPRSTRENMKSVLALRSILDGDSPAEATIERLSAGASPSDEAACSWSWTWSKASAWKPESHSPGLPILTPSLELDRIQARRQASGVLFDLSQRARGGVVMLAFARPGGLARDFGAMLYRHFRSHDRDRAAIKRAHLSLPEPWPSSPSIEQLEADLRTGWGLEFQHAWQTELEKKQPRDVDRVRGVLYLNAGYKLVRTAEEGFAIGAALASWVRERVKPQESKQLRLLILLNLEVSDGGEGDGEARNSPAATPSRDAGSASQLQVDCDAAETQVDMLGLETLGVLGLVRREHILEYLGRVPGVQDDPRVCEDLAKHILLACGNRFEDVVRVMDEAAFAHSWRDLLLRLEAENQS